MRGQNEESSSYLKWQQHFVVSPCFGGGVEYEKGGKGVGAKTRIMQMISEEFRKIVEGEKSLEAIGEPKSAHNIVISKFDRNYDATRRDEIVKGIK